MIRSPGAIASKSPGHGHGHGPGPDGDTISAVGFDQLVTPGTNESQQHDTRRRRDHAVSSSSSSSSSAHRNVMLPSTDLLSHVSHDEETRARGEGTETQEDIAVEARSNLSDGRHADIPIPILIPIPIEVLLRMSRHTQSNENGALHSDADIMVSIGGSAIHATRET